MPKKKVSRKTDLSKRLSSIVEGLGRASSDLYSRVEAVRGAFLSGSYGWADVAGSPSVKRVRREVKKARRRTKAGKTITIRVE